MKSTLDTIATAFAGGLAMFSVWYFVYDLRWPSVGNLITLVISVIAGAFIVDLVRGR